ncbi:MAG TPA: hypothetical protein VLH39_07125 [Magnetospirillaceae bacterium]|nr:hypothetical protein [Magnetospirillaceae bacterium]
MDASAPLFIVSRLAVTAVATFLAIVVWSRTRDLAWMLMVVGTIAGYADILYDLLSQLGVVPDGLLVAPGVPLAAIVFSNLSTLLYGAAFAVMVARVHRS